MKCLVQDVVAHHINHIRQVAGVDHVGIGGDYNGIDISPVDSQMYPLSRGVHEALIMSEVEWRGDEDLGKLASGNINKSFKEVEESGCPGFIRN